MFDQDGRDLDRFGQDLREEFGVKSVHEHVSEESHVRHREPNQDFQEIKGAASTKPSVENGGKKVTWPSLTQYLDGFGGEPREPEVRRSARVKAAKKSEEEGVIAERAVYCRRSRSGHLGELRKNWNRVQELMKSPEVDVITLEDSVRKYNEAFRKFVDAHEVCMEIEDDEERRALLVDSYENQRDMKWQLENLLNEWRANKHRPKSPRSESGFSRASSSYSIKEKTKFMEEARLRVNALKQKQDLDRQMEQIEKQKAELSRKIELMDAETQAKQAAIDLMIERYVTEEDVEDSRREIEKHDEIAPQYSYTRPRSPLERDDERSKKTFVPVVTSEFVAKSTNTQVPDTVSSFHHSIPSVSTTCYYTSPQMASTPFSLPEKFTIPPQASQVTPRASTSPYVPVLQNPTPMEFRPSCTPPSLPRESSMVEAWTTIAQAIKQGPSLPKVELMKFSGDPLEYAEFVTNFKDNIESQVSDESQRLTRLLAQCVGKAKEAIRSCVNLPVCERYVEAWKTLHQNFGQSHMVADAHVRRLKEIQIRRADASSLMEFARKLEDARRVLTSMGYSYSSRLDNEETIVMLMKKLPDEGLKRKWADKAGDIIKLKGRAEYADFVQFVKNTADRINNRYGQELRVTTSMTEREKRDPKKERSDQRYKVTTLAVQSDQSPRPSTTAHKCPQCSGPHGVWRCWKFKSSSLKDRFKLVRQHGLCRACLEEGHCAKSCTKGFKCRISGCGKDHHYLIHSEDVGGDRAKDSGNSSAKSVERNAQAREVAPEIQEGTTSVKTTSQSTPPTVSPNAIAVEPNDPVTVSALDVSRPKVCFKVVPVKVSTPQSDKQIITYAFFDSGSDATLCTESLMDELQIKTKRQARFTMSTVNSQERKCGYEIDLKIESLEGDAHFRLENVLTTKNLPVMPKHVATNEEIKKWPHLEDLTLREIDRRRVTLLIGSDRPDIIEKELDRREGGKGEPFAVKTPFGWTVYGPIAESAESQVNVSLTSTEHEKLNLQIERMYKDEFGNTADDIDEGMSVEDHKAKEIMDKSAILIDGHYQLRLPFRQDRPILPDSRPAAEKRLEWLKKKMQKDEVFKEKYSQVMEKYRTEGSSREVREEELQNLKPLWFLPHHAVWHPRKPDEPRVVFDCAAKSGGTSLNEQLLQGPENTSPLIEVILRFRVNEVAVAADIKRMFHQVHVAPEDCGALCYLWWPEGDISKEPKVHQMLVHIFGATSSPSIAGYALRKTAKDSEHDFTPETTNAVYKDFYVDDLLKSFADVAQAIRVSKQLQTLLARGGFKLTKWVSNHRQVLSEFPAEERAPAIKDLDLTSESLPVDRALGIHWDVEQDTFNLAKSSKKHPENRKGVLSSVATVYDPLGFASPLLLPGREINQELCHRRYDWDENLPPDVLASWVEWKEGLASLGDLSIPRCFKPKNFGTVVRTELHHFADASQEHGYGTVSYLRQINDRGQIHCSFVMGKSRVRPLKSTMTVPKLELTAAALLVRMNKLIVRALQGRLQIDSVSYWTDSIIVLRYIFNEVRRFITFVANRVAVIRQESVPDQWKHVRSELNPADYASRGIKATESRKLLIWRQGPEFLWKEEEEWPPQPPEMSATLSETDEGVKKEKVTVGATTLQLDFWNSLFNKYSTWNRLRRTVAWLIRAVRKLIGVWPRKAERDCTKNLQPSQETLSVSEVEQAERRIAKFVQRESFLNIQAGEDCLSKEVKERFIRLKPISEDGVIRVGGRLDRSHLSYDAKHPIILPGKHPVTELIIRHYHHRNGHVGTNQVLAEIRQRFWIVSGISSVKRVLRKCHECRRQNAKMGEQITAPLPEVRSSSDRQELVYPFAAVGLDYFGPLYVKVGPNTRSKRDPSLNKRYGCIFTCLRYRAVHIEVAQDLSTDSFINAVIRFVSRRGPPRIIYSDNGTNFKGAELDVIKAMKTWNQEQIQDELNQRGVQWKFNPPAASHQGGVWERLIRSVRRILHSMLGERLVNDETLHTFLTEVEKIMNDRPITKVSSEPQDLEALTPNHILLLRKNASLAPDEIKDVDKYKARWKHAHLLANEFWQRWTKEYLPMLQERQKWLREKANFKVGDLVLLADKNTPRGEWPKALIEQTMPDGDGIVRRVKVRTADGEYHRDVRKLCMLEEELLKAKTEAGDQTSSLQKE